eukprot:Tbor_TRINITY_DN2411_c0_g1::TRINITY_DN2411_c0_g1_i1::g.2595::m.2595
MANLRALIPEGKQLTEEESQKIGDLQDEIDAIWNKRGNYEIDPDAWLTMPIFMDTITEEDIQKNESCAAIAAVVYDELPPEEIAENRKNHGNECLKRAMNPDQVNKDNMARAAVNCYTDGLNAAKEQLQNDPENKHLIAQLYGNRSMANFLMKNYGHSLLDAQRSIIVDNNYFKGYYRGAKAAERVRKYDIALSLIEKGRQTEPIPPEQAMKEFEEIENVVILAKEQAAKKEKADKMKTRVKAAETSNIMRAITSKGIKITIQNEVTSEQMSQYSIMKPYFGASDDVLHVPLLFMFDEYQQTDFMQDVSTELCLAELVDELMPFPWDDRGRYAKIHDVVAVFKIDDGVQIPEYYCIDLGWPLLEVFRQPTYQMPRLLPVIHIISRHSDRLIEEWGIAEQLKALGM